MEEDFGCGGAIIILCLACLTVCHCFKFLSIICNKLSGLSHIGGVFRCLSRFFKNPLVCYFACLIPLYYLKQIVQNEPFMSFGNLLAALVLLYFLTLIIFTVYDQTFETDIWSIINGEKENKN